jgi:phosphate:Na+ symporter
MVVGFVNAGFMTLGQAIGVIMGANIGTTITGWILVLTIGKYGLPLLGISALVFRFSRREGLRYLAMATMGVGMVFFGLELMKNGFRPIRQMEEFSKWFAAFSADNYFGVLKCAIVGCVLTMIVQSSSATLGITIGLAATGVIRFEAAAALVLGENIGTTITACLASIGTTTNAKRAAYAHVIFNLIGVAWITALFGPYLAVVKLFLGDGFSNLEELNPRQVTAAIAAVHTGFNVTNTLVFLPFTRRLADFLTRLVPERAYREPPHLTKLDNRLLSTPVIGIEQSRIEILRMADMLRKMLFRVGAIISSNGADDRSVKKVFHKEEVMDIMQKEVTIFLTGLLSASVTHDIADEARRLLRMADEYESVSDYAANIVKLHLRLHESNLEFSPVDRQNILELHQEVQAYVEMVKTGYEQNRPEIVSKAHTRGDGITHRIRELRNQHLVQVAQRRSEPLVTVIYTDMLNAYRRVKDHAMNVAEAVAGEK